MEEYAENFPKGRRLAELRKRLAALAAPSTDGAQSGVADSDDDEDATEPSVDAPAAEPASR
jgi:hypothetical protein